jgi:hypothetical protein
MAIDITSELRQDAVSCFFEFLRRVRVDPDLLLCEDSHIERRKLEDAVGILLEADDIRREFDVSPLPIHEALGRSLKEAEELLEKMHNVATALRRLHEAEVVFAEYRMWLEEVQETLQHWEHYEENEIEKAIRYGARLERQQAQYETCAREISQIVEELHRSQYWASAEHEVEEKLRLVAAVEEDLFSDIAPGERRDRMDVDQGVACMRGILDELRELRTRLLGRSAKEKLLVLILMLSSFTPKKTESAPDSIAALSEIQSPAGAISSGFLALIIFVFFKLFFVLILAISTIFLYWY